MANTLKFGAGEWATKKGSTLAYNSENGNFKPLPFTFVRDTSATRVNKEGLIEVVSNNEPRIDFLNDSKGALLLEPSRSNIIQQSNKYDTYWVLNNITVASDQIGVGGNTEAWKITANSGSGEKKLNINLSVSGNHAISIYAKKGTKDYVYLRGVTSGLNKRVYFNLANGTIETDEAISSKMTNMGDGWYRCEAVFNQQLGFEFFFGITESDNTASYTDDGTGTIYVQYAQAEQGSYATSYIPTQGGVGTRDRELSDTQNLSHVIGQTEGVIFYDAILIHKSTSTSEDFFELSIDDGSNQNIFFINNYNNGLTVAMVNGGSYQFTNNSFNPTEGARYKLAFAYKQNDFALYINGNQIATSSSGTVTTMNQITFGNYYNNSPNLSNSVKVNEFKFYNTRLSNSELQTLTQI